MNKTHIVIVNYNAGHWLQKSLSSALLHSDGPVTVVDNNSTDNSIATCKALFDGKPEFERIRWQLNSTNKGFAAANNQVLTTLDAEFAVLLNPDCILYENTLEIMLQTFADNSDIGMASCRILNADGSLQASCRRRFPTPKTALVRFLGLRRWFPALDFDYGQNTQSSDPVAYVDAISGAFMMVRKSAIESVGGLDEEYFMHCEDLDWCMRFKQQGWKVAFVPQACARHEKGVSSQTRPLGVLWNLHRGMDRYFGKFHRHSNPFFRILVRLGIYLSFIPRTVVVLIRHRFQH